MQYNPVCNVFNQWWAFLPLAQSTYNQLWYDLLPNATSHQEGYICMFMLVACYYCKYMCLDTQRYIGLFKTLYLNFFQLKAALVSLLISLLWTISRVLWRSWHRTWEIFIVIRYCNLKSFYCFFLCRTTWCAYLSWCSKLLNCWKMITLLLILEISREPSKWTESLAKLVESAIDH